MGRSFRKYTTCILVHLLTFGGGIFWQVTSRGSVASSVKWETIIPKLSEAEAVFSKILSCFISDEKKKLRFSVSLKRRRKKWLKNPGHCLFFFSS